MNQEQQISQKPIETAQPQIQEKEKENVDTSQQAKEYFKKLVNSLKEQINTNNGITYYTFLYELKNGCDENNSLNIETLFNAFKSIGLNIPQNDINNFFNLLDFSGTGKIALDDIINTIVDPILDHRKYYIVNKFAKFDTEKKGEVLISLLKEKYNPKGHPDVIAGKISEEEAFKQFCYTLDIYCGIRMVKDAINYKQFVEYYNGISSSILDENYFIDILNGVWGDDNIINNNQQNQPKSTINEDKNMNANNFMNSNNGYQRSTNRRYNFTKNQNNNLPIKYNDSYADSNLGINSLLLGESSHVLPKSFGKKFQKI
jgi:Ca2+-binding EF-hand superfamily protein